MKDQGKNEFISFAKTYNGPYTCIKEVGWWLNINRKFKACETVQELKSLMRESKLFTKRDIRKLNDAQTFFFDNKHLFVKKKG